MARRHFAFEGLDHDAERLQLFLVALELAAHRLTDLVVAREPVGLVVVHLAQDLLARDRICPVEEEGEEVEPALGLGHCTVVIAPTGACRSPRGTLKDFLGPSGPSVAAPGSAARYCAPARVFLVPNSCR